LATQIRRAREHVKRERRESAPAAPQCAIHNAASALDLPALCASSLIE
jgi:hypothetical protein